MFRKDFSADIVNWYTDDNGRKLLLNIDIEETYILL
jgi:hypothetical protein